jgi:hypothetical protein
MDIHEFLALPHRFRWGGVDGDDCMTFPASWVLACMGIDRAANLRGTYRTQEEAHGILASFSGALPFMEHHLVKIGAKRIQHPQTGDVGLVTAPIGHAAQAQIGAVRFGPLWACIHPAGVRRTQLPFIAAWRLPC